MNPIYLNFSHLLLHPLPHLMYPAHNTHHNIFIFIYLFFSHTHKHTPMNLPPYFLSRVDPPVSADVKFYLQHANSISSIIIMQMYQHVLNSTCNTIQSVLHVQNQNVGQDFALLYIHMSIYTYSTINQTITHSFPFFLHSSSIPKQH